MPLDGCDAKVFKVLVEYCRAFLGEWWRTIVLFLPDHSAVGAPAGATQRECDGGAEGVHGKEIVFLQPLRKLWESLFLSHCFNRSTPSVAPS